MPLMCLHTNQSVSEEARAALLEALTEVVVSALNKPKDYVQILVVPEATMAFAGTGEPTAFVELRSLGLPPEKLGIIRAWVAILDKLLSDLSNSLCGIT